MNQQLAQWFEDNKRALPWRDNPSPYQVWISEVMLQQTQVAVVLPYFHRWMQAFPSIQDLANAEESTVIKLWEGLGYYSRARNLHRAAKQIVREFSGTLPSDTKSLSTLPGLGPYTVNAIRAFAFHERSAAVDGNVQRVIARYYGIEESVAKRSTQVSIQELADAFLPQESPWVVAEALIELGARICTKKPNCVECPIQSKCQAKAKGIADQLPNKPKRAQTQKLFREVAVIQFDDKYLIQCGEAGKVMEDLFEFPYLASCEAGMPEHQIIDHFQDRFELSLNFHEPLASVHHTFTRYHATLRPFLFQAKAIRPVEGHQWRSHGAMHQLPFSSGHRKILQQITAL